MDRARSGRAHRDGVRGCRARRRGAAGLSGAVELYLATRSETYERLNRLLGGLDGDIEVGLAALTVALRQVRGVAA